MTRRRTSPAENPDFELNLPELPPAEPPADDLSGKKAPFFDYVLDLEPAEAERCTVWLYRRWPKIQNAPGEKAYIAVIPLPVSPCLEEHIVQEHGGGVYQMFLKKKEPGQKAVLMHQLDNWQAAGEPKIPAGTTVLESAAPGAPGAGAGGQNGGGLTNEAQLKLLDMASTKQNAGEDVGALAVRKAVEQAVEIMGMTAKKEAGADPVAQAFATMKLINELRPPAAPMGELEKFTAMARALREINAEMNPAPAPVRAPRESGGGLALIREAVDLVKGDEEGIVRRLLMGEHEPEPPSGLAAVFTGFVQPMLAATPQLPAALGGFLVELFNRRGAPAPQPVPRPAPQLQAPGQVLPARAAEPQPAPAVPAAEPAPSNAAAPDAKDAMVREVLVMIARGYSAGRTGEYVAHGLNGLLPEIIPDLQGLLGQLNDAAVMAWLQTQAPIRPLLSEPGFADFFADLKEQILAGFDEDGEEEEDDDEDGEEVITSEAAVPGAGSIAAPAAAAGA